MIQYEHRIPLRPTNYFLKTHYPGVVIITAAWGPTWGVLEVRKKQQHELLFDVWEDIIPPPHLRVLCRVNVAPIYLQVLPLIVLHSNNAIPINSSAHRSY